MIFIKSKQQQQSLSKKLLSIKNFSWFDFDEPTKKMKKLRKIAQDIKKNGTGTKAQKYAQFKEEAMKTGLFDSKDSIHKSFIDVLFDS